MDTYKMLKVNPAGNITAFVFAKLEKSKKIELANHIMGRLDPTVEQVGFIYQDGDSLRMDMMGDEFCANASRSFGLYLARKMNLEGVANIMAHVSGRDLPVQVSVDTLSSSAQVGLGPARSVDSITIAKRAYTLVVLDGISHVIVPQRQEDKDLVYEIIDFLEENHKDQAYGVLFFDEKVSFMVPYVYVGGTKSLIRESSCGSGTIALAYYLNDKKDLNFKRDIHQPGGTISLEAGASASEIFYKIGGPVEFMDTTYIEY